MKKKWMNTFSLRCFAILLIMAATLVLTGSQRISAAEQEKSPYLIKVNRYHNTITVYEQDKIGEYSVPIKAITCSVGSYSRTIKGTFALKEKYRWKALMGDVWGQYSTRIVGGILFHSVYYYENNNPASLATAEYNKLGKAASHGCIRLTVADAKWIYDNCPSGTLVEIFDDKSSPGPLGKPKTIKIDKTVRWDPTDPDERNPYLSALPKLVGVEGKKIAWGKTIDPMEGVTAFSSSGEEITDQVVVEGEINPYVAGEYKLTYSVEDEYGKVKIKTARFNVGKSKDSPMIIGVSDRIVANINQINEEYAVSDIKIYCGDMKMDQKLLQVEIEKKNEEEYYITYKVDLGMDNIEIENATFYVDNIAPFLTGVADKVITPEVTLTQEEALADVTVQDNYSSLTIDDVQVTLEQKEEGYYLITYTVADEAGNICSTQAKYYFQ
jgi:hypothetical protein